MIARIQNLSLPANRRILAVSDIHGELGYLRGLLEKTAFGRNDILIGVGDMLEKGSDSLGTLRYIISLCKTNTVFPLLGNCDEWSRAGDEENPWNENYVRAVCGGKHVPLSRPSGADVCGDRLSRGDGYGYRGNEGGAARGLFTGI
jgi:hypothetical protein